MRHVQNPGDADEPTEPARAGAELRRPRLQLYIVDDATEPARPANRAIVRPPVPITRSEGPPSPRQPVIYGWGPATPSAEKSP